MLLLKKCVMPMKTGIPFLMLFFLCVASAHAAEPTKTSSVGIVDVQRIMQDSLAAKSVSTQLEVQRSKFQAQIAAEEADLRGAEQKLAKLREAGQGEAYSEQEQQLRQRFLTVERHVQGRRKVLDQAFTDSMNTVRKNIVDIVKAVANERGITLVVVKQQVIWNDSAIDMTEEVLTRMNKALPKVTVSLAPEESVGEASALILKRQTPKPGRK